MRSDRIFAVGMILASVVAVGAQSHPRDGEIRGADTLGWWHTTEALSSDAMEGRDTGSAAYQRAANYVAARFRAAGLKPAGEDGTYFQAVPMHEVDVVPERASFAEKRYWDWYEERYHRPQDDLTQPMDFLAAAKFNVFFYRLVETVAATPERPSIFADSPFAVKK